MNFKVYWKFFILQAEKKKENTLSVLNVLEGICGELIL